jgi:signal transduction histidine kinase
VTAQRGARVVALALLGGAMTALEGLPAASIAAGAVVVAALGIADRHPRATRIVALVALLVTAPAGAGLAPAIAAAGHVFVAGRRESTVASLAWLAALVAALQLGVILASGSPVPALIAPLAAWWAGRALRERELVAGQLAERAGELEEEREAHAALSVRFERARIASELHDIVGHAISIMVVQASAGQRLVASDPRLAADTFATIAGAARQAEADMGRLVALLGDERAIGRAPDVSLVEELVARAAASGLDITLRLEGQREGLPASVSELAYRVVQEGLTNALRYAGGAAICVLVRGDEQALVVEVANTPGPRASTLMGAGTGNGLRGLRERVVACAGTLDAGSAPGGGWLLRVELPRRLPVAA